MPPSSSTPEVSWFQQRADPGAQPHAHLRAVCRSGLWDSGTWVVPTDTKCAKPKIFTTWPFPKTTSSPDCPQAESQTSATPSGAGAGI